MSKYWCFWPKWTETDGTFADDMALMAVTIEKLQLLMECLNRYWTKVDMKVNVKKTIGTVFSNPKKHCRNRHPLIYESKNIEHQDFLFNKVSILINIDGLKIAYLIWEYAYGGGRVKGYVGIN
jgi:hypothetical protein